MAVLRRSKTSVLIMRHKIIEDMKAKTYEMFCPMILFRVLCPVDFSRYSATTFFDVPPGSMFFIADSNGTLIRSWSDCPGSVIWNGTDMQGRPVISGRYFWSIPETPFKGVVLIQ
jgi:hypothetical protein